MRTDTRRVTAFIIIGLLIAAGVGVAVWRAGAPGTSKSDIATTGAANTADTHSPDTHVVGEGAYMTIHPPQTREKPKQGRRVNPLSDDPFLAPNAVFNTAPLQLQPTTIYRPDNISRRGQGNRSSVNGARSTADAATRTGVNGAAGQTGIESPAGQVPTADVRTTVAPTVTPAITPTSLPTPPRTGSTSGDESRPQDPGANAPETAQPAPPVTTAAPAVPTTTADEPIDVTTDVVIPTTEPTTEEPVNTEPVTSEVTTAPATPSDGTAVSGGATTGGETTTPDSTDSTGATGSTIATDAAGTTVATTAASTGSTTDAGTTEVATTTQGAPTEPTAL